MKKPSVLALLALCMAVPSFAKNVVGHSAEVAGKDTANVAKVTARDTAKASVKVVKFLF